MKNNIKNLKKFATREVTNLNISQHIDQVGTLEPDDEGKNGDEHDGLDVEDHIYWVGELLVRSLHDQLR